MEPPLAAEYQLPASYMLWSSDREPLSASIRMPHGYEIRPYQWGDELQLHPLFITEGWPIDATQWQDYLDHILPNGLFVLWDNAQHQVIGTAGAIHNPRGGRYYFPFGGEVAYLVVHPQHRGHGLGAVLTAYVLQRLQAACYHHIWLGVQGFRLPAIKTYLKLGFVPLLHQEGLADRWQRICEQLHWPYTPDAWPRSINGTPAQSRT